MELDELMLALRDAVAADAASPESIGAALHAEVVRAEAPMPWELRLAEPRVTSAALVLQADGELSHLELVLAPASDLALGKLSALFGEPHPLPLMHWNRPAQVAFYPATRPGQRFTCAIIASLSPGEDPTPSSRVSGLVFRRDPVL